MQKYHYEIVLPFSRITGYDTPENIAAFAANHAESNPIEVYIVHTVNGGLFCQTLAWASPGIY